MENNSKSYIVIVILLVCDFTFAIDGTCSYKYYPCSGYEWCCPDSYDCSGTSKCYKTVYYYSSEPGSSSNVGPIIGYCIGGLVGLVFLAAFCVACCAKCTCERPGQIEAMDTQTGGQNRAATTIRY
ncbi:Hypothetical predicted protein [Mytilus galloprovincialis]|uniref:Uncharacterized protein n=1 Tax=Mytilus galloprovincialis TaxID=29158 RepID=A0A8B6D6C1_MYTGA|nr:Hypothetical predicted protein [Mytilus galloprovincialis]